MRKLITAILTFGMVLSLGSVSAFAADYSFTTESQSEYYSSTEYSSMYGSGYNYGGVNVVDYVVPDLEYGIFSNAQTGAMEKIKLPDLQQVSTGNGSYAAITNPGLATIPSDQIWDGTYQQIGFTDASTLVRSDGSIGTLKISTLNINMKVFEGETTASMKKGVGHFTSTSGWNGNIGICGHNRGATYTIGTIKDLELGDTIKYTTTLGTRTYSVTSVCQISSSDWTYLTATSDNRITLVTCVSNHPTLRWCVQAVEVK